MSNSKLMAANRLRSGQEYVGQNAFMATLVAAFFLHLVAVYIWQSRPQTRVIDVPVRTLNIKLGDDDTADALPPVLPTVTDNADAENTVTHMVAEQPTANQARVQAVTHSMDKAMSPTDATPKAVDKAFDKAFAGTSAAPPRQFVREKAAQPATAKTPGSTAGNSTKKDAEMLSRYNQLISLWILKFQVYPPEARSQGMHGETVVRIRIDRQGNIRYYILEHSTGYQVLDRAAIDMIRRANPVPAVPNDYPSEDLMEFLIPVNFTIQ